MKRSETKPIAAQPLDRASLVLHIVLSVLYFPLSLFSFLLFMASELAIGATNPVYISLVMIFSHTAIAIPLLCILCSFFSARLRKRGQSKASILIQFIPLLVFVLNFAFLFALDLFQIGKYLPQG